MVITVVGLGFVGLTSALGFASLGHKVYGIEINESRLATIASGKLPFLEPGLDEALAQYLEKHFFPSNDIAKAVHESDIIYFCVGTPYGQDGQADLTFLFEALRQTLAHAGDGKFRVLVTKSTIPPGTTAKRVTPFVASLDFTPGTDIGVACNPEFLREGHCWEDFVGSDRVVIGVSDTQSELLLRKLYQNMRCPIFCVSPNTAEFIKYLSNTLLATLISYSNEMSLAADAFGDIDVAEAFHILHMDRRWGGCDMASYAYPGCGYGGYCLPKDTNALYAAAKHSGYEPHILGSVIAVNDAMPDAMAARIAGAADLNKNACIGILGLSFKPGSDDVRDAPPAKIIRALNMAGYHNILAFDPVVKETEFKQLYNTLSVHCAQTLQDVLDKADVLALTTAWPEFLKLRNMTGKTIVDCRYALASSGKRV